MIIVNDNSYNWFINMTVYDLFSAMGYKLQKPAVLIKVNNEVIRRDVWEHFHIPDMARISIVNLLYGG